MYTRLTLAALLTTICTSYGMNNGAQVQNNLTDNQNSALNLIRQRNTNVTKHGNRIVISPSVLAELTKTSKTRDDLIHDFYWGAKSSQYRAAETNANDHQITLSQNEYNEIIAYLKSSKK